MRGPKQGEERKVVLGRGSLVLTPRNTHKGVDNFMNVPISITQLISGSFTLAKVTEDLAVSSVSIFNGSG